MIVFDPNEQKRQLDGDCGYEWELSRPYEKAHTLDEIVARSGSDLHTAVQCILVGYSDPAIALLTRVCDWLGANIDDDAVEAHGHLYLALCKWLLRGEHDADNYAVYVSKYTKFSVEAKLTRDKPNVNFSLPSYVNARAYEEALAWFHQAGMIPPKSLDRIRSGGAMSYVLSRHYLGQEYDAEDVAAATRKFLKYNVNTWLTRGYYLDTAEWMKIAHWSGEPSRTSAWEAVLHCYDYLAASPPTDRPINSTVSSTS
jgi:hypothetical protein